MVSSPWWGWRGWGGGGQLSPISSPLHTSAQINNPTPRTEPAGLCGVRHGDPPSHPAPRDWEGGDGQWGLPAVSVPGGREEAGHLRWGEHLMGWDGCSGARWVPLDAWVLLATDS